MNEGAGDFDDLLLSGGQGRGNPARVYRRALVEAAENFGGRELRPSPGIELPQRAGARLVAEHDVFRDRHVGDDHQFLEYGDDPTPARIAGRIERDVAPSHANPAGVRLYITGQNTDQRGFPGAILADECMNLAGS